MSRICKEAELTQNWCIMNFRCFKHPHFCSLHFLGRDEYVFPISLHLPKIDKRDQKGNLEIIPNYIVFSIILS